MKSVKRSNLGDAFAGRSQTARLLALQSKQPHRIEARMILEGVALDSLGLGHRGYPAQLGLRELHRSHGTLGVAN